MKRIIALLVTPLITALLIPALATHVASASPSYKRSPSINTNVVMTYTFPITETGVDSLAFEVNGLCSVVYESAGSDDASLYAVPTGATATTSGTLIVAYTDSSTVPTVFQPGTRWVRAVAVSAVTGGSIMRVTCSNTQMASTGEACGTSGLAPYVGTGGRYKCEPEYSYDDVDNELNVGSITLDPIAGKNVVRFPGISAFTGPNPAATEVLLYGLDTDQELYVENLDGLNAPSRVVVASPEYAEQTLEWGVAFTDIDNEYATITAGTTTTQNFCMIKGPAVVTEKAYDSDGQTGDVVIPLTGATGCSKAVSSTKPEQIYVILGDPFIKDVWCTSNTNIATTWISGDGATIEFGISNAVDVVPSEYLTAVHTLDYSFDAVDTEYGIGLRHSLLRAAVDDYASNLFSGTIGSGITMVMFSGTIASVTRQTASTWTSLRLHCGLTFEYRDTR